MPGSFPFRKEFSRFGDDGGEVFGFQALTDFLGEAGAVAPKWGGAEEGLVFLAGQVGEFALELLGPLLFAAKFLGEFTGFTGEESAEFVFEVFVLGEEFDISLGNGFLHLADVGGEALQVGFAGDVGVYDAEEFDVSDGEEVLGEGEFFLHEVEDADFPRGDVVVVFEEGEELGFCFSFYEVVSNHGWPRCLFRGV